jgi:hypothetical protein
MRKEDEDRKLSIDETQGWRRWECGRRGSYIHG